MESYEDPVEQQILQAMAEGKFDDLPGRGKPLDLGDDSPAWWARRRIEEMRRHDELVACAGELSEREARLWLLPTEETVRAGVNEINVDIDRLNSELPAEDQLIPLSVERTVATWKRMYRLHR